MRNDLLLPEDIEALTPEWMTAALSASYPGVVVRQIEQLHVIHGSATKIRVRLQYEEGTQGDLPNTMWIKIGFEPHSRVIEERGLYGTEAVCYGKLLSGFDFAVPRSYFQAVQDDPPQVVILLEDLINRGAAFGLATQPMHVDRAAAGLDALALIHAKTWNGEKLSSLGLHPLLRHRGVGEFLLEFVEQAESYLSAPRCGDLPAALRDKKRLSAAYFRYLDLAVQAPVVLVHGDTHIGNTFIEPNGAVGFLDWQCAAIGNGLHDVTYFLVSAIEERDRRASERDLIAGYLDALKRHGVARPPTFEEAWLSYRQSLIYGFVVWLGNPNTMQPESVCKTCLDRFASAMSEHDGFGVHGV